MNSFERGMQNAKDAKDKARKGKKNEEEGKKKDKMSSVSKKERNKMKNAVSDMARRAGASAEDATLLAEIKKVRLSVNAKKSKSNSQEGSPSHGGCSSQAGSSSSGTNAK